MCSVLVQVLLEDDGEPLLECVRCYGNLSRHQPVRDSIVKSKGKNKTIFFELAFIHCDSVSCVS